MPRRTNTRYTAPALEKGLDGLELAHRHPPADRLLDAAVPHMQALASRTGQTNHLSVHHDARLVVLARVITAFQSSERRAAGGLLRENAGQRIETEESPL